MRIPALLICFVMLATGIQSQTYAEWVEKSYDYLEADKLSMAEECLQSALRLEPANPNNFALLTNLGTIQRQQGKWEEAITSYTAALGRQPENTGILDSRASLYVEVGDVENAINDYTNLLALEPTNQNALYNRGLLYLQEKVFLMAEADFDRMLELNEKSVHGRVGHALLEKMRGNYDYSERIYNYLISKLPRDWSLYEGRADLYFQMGKNARAIADINRVFSETEPSASLYVLRGKVKVAQHEREAAQKDFQKALEMGYDAETINELMKTAK